MAKLQLLPVLVVLSLALAGDALESDGIVLQGRVYCDTCRAGFETILTENLPGNYWRNLDAVCIASPNIPSNSDPKQ